MNEIQNELAGATVALGATITAAMDDAPGFVPCGTPAQVVLDALNAAAPLSPRRTSRSISQAGARFCRACPGHRQCLPTAGRTSRPSPLPASSFSTRCLALLPAQTPRPFRRRTPLGSIARWPPSRPAMTRRSARSSPQPREPNRGHSRTGFTAQASSGAPFS